MHKEKNKKDILFGIKLIIRNELVSYHYKFKTLFLVLKNDKSLLLILNSVKKQLLNMF